MSGKTDKGVADRGKSKDGKSVSRSKKPALQFPVDRVHRYLKQGKYVSRIGAGAPVYLTAVLDESR
jgi:histone H2A